MSTKILKTSMLALAGAVALAAAGSASAMAPPYLACNYKGSTNLVVGGSARQCWLNLAVKVDCDGNVIEVTAAGPNPGDPACAALFTGNFPWTGDLPDIMAGMGAIDTTTGSGGMVPFSVMDANGNPLAGGTVTGVEGITPQNHQCDGNTVTVPHTVRVTGTNNFGPLFGNFATFNTVAPDHLMKQTCDEVL